MTRAGIIAACGAVVALCGTYISWNEGSARSTTTAPAAIDGQALFRAKGCATCHTGPDSNAAVGAMFPSLAYASSWASDRKPGYTAQEYLRESMLQPGVFISPVFTPSGGPTTGMPDLHLTPAEAEALASYLLRA